jgi:hypothetical protein
VIIIHPILFFGGLVFQELLVVSSTLNKSLGSSSKSTRSKMQVVAEDSKKVCMQLMLNMPYELLRFLLGKQIYKNFFIGMCLQDSSEAASSLVEPLVKFAKSRRSKKIGVTASNKVGRHFFGNTLYSIMNERD